MTADLRPALQRWEDAGGVWRVVSQRADHAVVALCRCDAGEEVERLSTGDPATLRMLAERPASDRDPNPVQG